MILQLLLAMLAGWLQRHQQQVITYLQAENRILKAQLGGRRLRLSDTERRRLAALAHALGHKRLKDIATIATPETLLRWYHRLITQKFDGSRHDRQFGRPRVAEEIEPLVVRGEGPIVTGPAKIAQCRHKASSMPAWRMPGNSRERFRTRITPGCYIAARGCAD